MQRRLICLAAGLAVMLTANVFATPESMAQPQGSSAPRCYFGNSCREGTTTQPQPTPQPTPQPQPQPSPNPPSGTPQPNSEMSSVCQFSSGPNPGAIVNFVGVGEAPVGTYCQDNLGNRGAVVSRSHPYAGMAINLVFSSRCYFNFGPLTGQIVDYSPMGKVQVGTPCNDGAGSLGFVIQ